MPMNRYYNCADLHSSIPLTEISNRIFLFFLHGSHPLHPAKLSRKYHTGIWLGIETEKMADTHSFSTKEILRLSEHA